MNSIDILKIIIVLLFVLFLIIVILAYNINLKLKKENEEIVYNNINRKNLSKNKLLSYYEFLSEFKITKNYVKKIRHQYQIIFPDDKQKIIENTMKTIILIWSIDLIYIIIILLNNFNLYRFIVLMTLLYLLNNEILYIIIEKKEISLLKQLENYLADVRHFYFSHNMIDEAIYEALDKAEYEIKLHASKIYEILISENSEEEVQKYNETVPNKFLKTFVAICITLINYGDKEVNGQSLFLNNLKNLKQEINIEVLKRQKINYLFSGLIFVTVAPIFFLKAIENWAIYNFADLESFYKGSFGIIVSVIIFIMTIFCYKLIHILKENSVIESNKHLFLKKILKYKIVKEMIENSINYNYGKYLKLKELLKKVGESITAKEFILKRNLYMIGTFFICIITFFILHINNKNLYINNNNLNIKSSVITAEQEKEVKDIVIKYTYLYKNQEVTREDIQNNIKNENINKLIIDEISNEIFNRVKSYNKEYFKWYELIFSILISILAYYIPYWLILYKKKIMQMNMEDEVIQFQSIILMLIYIDNITIDVILEWLENFAVIFRQSIMECLNDINKGDIEALNELAKKEPFEPFVRIVENFKMCDKIGIKKAFDEIAIDRLNYQEKRKQENEIYISNKSAIGKVIAYIPMILVLGGYLIIPFVSYSLKELSSYLMQMSTF